MAPSQHQPLWYRARAAVDHPAFWFAMACALLWYSSAPLSDHPDTLRDLLQARDCAESGRCIAGGAHASVGGLRSGALWSATLAAMRWLDLPSDAVQPLVLGADSAAVALLAAVQGPWSAALLTAGLIGATREHLVWSPALTPLAAALAAAAWQRARQTQHLGWWLALGASLGVQADLHPVGALYGAAALAVIPWSAQRPLTTTLASGFTLIVFAAALAPEVQLSNLRAVHQRHEALFFAGAATLITAPIAAETLRTLRSRLHGSSSLRPALIPTPQFVAALLGAAGVALGALWGLGGLHPRYLLGALPGLALGLGSALALPTPIALCLIVALALLTGPASLGAGHPWPVVRQLARDLGRQGQSWPHYLNRVQGPGCRRLAAAVQAELPNALSPSAGSEDLVWQLIDLDDPAQPPGIDWQAAARWRDAGRNRTTWLRRARPWLRAHEGQACVVTSDNRVCQPLRPGVLALGTDQPPAASLPWHMRTFPAAVTLTLPAGPSQTTFRLPLAAAAAGRRLISLQELPRRRCPWHIEAVHGTGPSLRWTISADAQSLDVTASAAAEGYVLVTRSWGPGCDDPTEWESGPPCLLETELAP